ncbi:MAG: PA14 domain-containing protein, partial [Planctomycetota bacterium]
PESELVLIDQRDRHLWHNGGGMFFDEKGLLYVSLGDEGGDFGNENKIDRAFFSGVLRIDVDQDATRSHPIKRPPKNGTSDNYFVPNDNPWVGVPGALEEFWAIGFRSPHRMTYDPPTKRIFIGEVGDSTIEEVNEVEKGGNYQWRWMEGFNVHGARPKTVVGVEKPPLYAYDRSLGSCVIGGYVYRGEKNAELRGKYVFGDLNGAVWALEEKQGEKARAVRIATLPQAAQMSYGAGLSSFGVDQEGELYLCQLGDDGKLYKLVPAAKQPVKPPRLLSATGAFSDTEKLAPAKELLPYDVASPLWSDGAQKSRWIAAPAPAAFSQDEAWRFAAGTVFVKHFERDGRRLETRFLVVGQETYGLTYRWREDQKDAELVEGTVPEHGPDGWTFPSRDDCLRCHTPQAGWVLGARTRQLHVGDQLARWKKAGLVQIPSNARLEALADPRDATAPLVSRVRSYVDANCMHCHTPNGSGRGWFDARSTTPLDESGIVEGPVQDPLGLHGGRVVKGGDPQLSLLLERMKRTDAKRMPPLAVAKVDEAGARLIEEWVRSLPKSDSQVLHGLRGEYFEGEDLKKLVHERVDPAIDFDWNPGAPPPRLTSEHFSVRWKGFLEVPKSGQWTLSISVDDGGRLWVADKLVIDKWIIQGETNHSAKVLLEAGRKVPIVFEYFQGGGSTAARLFWEGPGQPRAIIPPARLTPEPARKWF